MRREDLQRTGQFMVKVGTGRILNAALTAIVVAVIMWFMYVYKVLPTQELKIDELTRRVTSLEISVNKLIWLRQQRDDR